MFSVLTLSAALAAPIPISAPSGPDPLDETFVVVWTDATVHAAPGAAQVTSTSPRTAKSGTAAMRVVEDRGTWLRVVDPIRYKRRDNTELHCASLGLFSESAFEIAVWIHEDDLVPVLTKPVRKVYADGTLLDLRPGVTAVDGHLKVDGHVVPFTPPKRAVGTRYRPALDGVPFGHPDFEMVDAKTRRATVGGQTVEPPERAAEFGYHRLNTERTHQYSATGCGAMQLAVEGVVEAEETNFGVGGILMGDLTAWETVPAIRIPRGTRLSWPDGSHAGVVRKDFEASGATVSSEPSTCLAVPRAGEQSTTVCVDSAAVQSFQADRRKPWGPQDPSVDVVN